MKLNITNFLPERSEKGKNLARNNKIRPQKTVFRDLDKRRKRSKIKNQYQYKCLCNILFIVI